MSKYNLSNNEIISVCIATYRRPFLLEKLLNSLLNQENIDDFKLEFIIVDNDYNKSAENVALKFSRELLNNPQFSLKYVTQPEKNIALTRNKAVQLATGIFLFFIDDDEYADRNCVHNHIKTIFNYKADMTIGNVISYFDDNIPDFIKSAYPFSKRNSKDGENTRFFITSNTMIYLSNIKKELIYFNPDYGLTGGSDNELFSRLYKKGYNIKSCSSSIAYEYVPRERANLIWLIKRVFRTGNNYTRTLLQNSSGNFNKILIGIAQSLKGFIQFLISLFLSIVIFPFSRKHSLNWFLRGISNFSKLFAVMGFYPKEYK